MVDTATTEQTKLISNSTVNEAISSEELLQIGVQLHKEKNDPDRALKLLKILDRKLITAEHLIATKIGKALTAVQD